MFTALVAGLADQQVANDPGGDRWVGPAAASWRCSSPMIDDPTPTDHQREGRADDHDHDSIDVTTIPRIDHDEAMAIAAVENRKFAAQLRSFGPDDWRQPTDCALWDVRAVAAHVVGSAAAQASPREFFRQKRKGRP